MYITIIGKIYQTLKVLHIEKMRLEKLKCRNDNCNICRCRFKKRNVFKSFLNIFKDEALLMLFVRLFHSAAAAVLIGRGPYVTVLC